MYLYCTELTFKDSEIVNKAKGKGFLDGNNSIYLVIQNFYRSKSLNIDVQTNEKGGHRYSIIKDCVFLTKNTYPALFHIREINERNL